MGGGGGGGADISELLGGLGMAWDQVSNAGQGLMLAQTGSFSQNDNLPKNLRNNSGKDGDGFDDEILISEDGTSENGMKDALNYDPLSS